MVPVYPVSEDQGGAAATLSEGNGSDDSDDDDGDDDDGDNDDGDDDMDESQDVNTGCSSKQPSVEAGILCVFNSVFNGFATNLSYITSFTGVQELKIDGILTLLSLTLYSINVLPIFLENYAQSHYYYAKFYLNECLRCCDHSYHYYRYLEM